VPPLNEKRIKNKKPDGYHLLFPFPPVTERVISGGWSEVFGYVLEKTEKESQALEERMEANARQKDEF